MTDQSVGGSAAGPEKALPLQSLVQAKVTFLARAGTLSYTTGSNAYIKKVKEMDKRSKCGGGRKGWSQRH